MKVLAIDTASARCSAALHIDGVVMVREVDTARGHAHMILSMVDALLAEAGLPLQSLTGIAFGRGPGSFTGVRIAAAVTQGLAFGAELPVLPISDLRALAAQALRRVAELGGPVRVGQVLACMDARMAEVYSGVFAVGSAQTLAPLSEEKVGSAEDVTLHPALPVIAAIGMGLSAYPGIAARLQIAAPRIFGTAEPSALDVLQIAMADLAAGTIWQDAAAAQPVYVRNKVVREPI
jgi:tRNA threonylcarbamoyladenosine biosynthesis protein TsaB